MLGPGAAANPHAVEAPSVWSGQITSTGTAKT
jgi:hypothetical protein